MLRDFREVTEFEEERLTRVIGDAALRGIQGATSVLLLRILSGPLKGNEAILLGNEPFVIGQGLDATLRLPDAAVSRRHLELVNKGGVITARDLGSTNGSFFEGTRFEQLELHPGSVFRVGETELQLVAPQKVDPLPPSEETAFGKLLGKSRRMREAFAILERAARSDATVLINGETGTGKEVAAESIHLRSARAKGPLIVVDCASIPANLIESELFGHVKGAYTNALSDRVGAFEAAHGGTIFLDEIGELPAALQPRLLRVLETRRIKRIGSNEVVPVDVRVIAATNRSLEEEVKAQRFRSDLYFRLAVVRVTLPPLRARIEDIPMLARSFLERHQHKGRRELELTPEVIAALTSYDWPGNVRELRNVMDQAASLSSEGLAVALRLKQRGGDAEGDGTGPEVPAVAPADAHAAPAELPATFRALLDQPYKEARRAALEAFELAYAQHAVEKAGGNVSRAAEQAQVHRNVLHRILARAKGDPAETGDLEDEV
jgi:two-component system nitrogen regulation response regulator GlnG